MLKSGKSGINIELTNPLGKRCRRVHLSRFGSLFRKSNKIRKSRVIFGDIFRQLLINSRRSWSFFNYAVVPEAEKHTDVMPFKNGE